MFEKFFSSFRSVHAAPAPVARHHRSTPMIEPVELRILMSGTYAQYRGVNAFGAYGAVGAGMSSWKIDIVRQDVPYFDQIPMDTSTALIGGSYLHGLQSIVADDANDTSNKVTILCPFTWDGTQILNNTPSATSYWGNENTAGTYNYRLKQEGATFAGTTNVWLEVWNEPYAYNGSATPATWLSDMETMVTSIRDGGFTGKIVIPGSQEGGTETPILQQGQTLNNFDPQHNVIFDLHAYDGWLYGQSQAQIASRMQTIINSGNQVIFGEYGPGNGEGGFNNTAPFIAAAAQEGVTAIAWNWSDGDSNTLHNSDGSLNNTTANYNWANQVMAYTQGTRTNTPTPNHTLPSGWTDNDINSPALTGYASGSGSSFSVTGSGDNITGNADQFNYASAAVTGNQTLVARVTNLSDTNSGATAGVMFRDSTASNSADAVVAVTPGGEVEFISRANSSGVASTTNATVNTGITVSSSTPVWLKLVKAGNSFTAFYGTGTAAPTTWTQVGAAATATFSNTTFRAGLSVNSYDITSLATALFDNVTD